MMAAPVTDMALHSSAWLKVNGGKYDMDPDSQKSLTQRDLYQDVNNCTQSEIPTTANAVDEYGNGDSIIEHGENRILEADSLPLESFSDDWWDRSISCTDDYQPYDIDQAEEAPYWLNSERRLDSAANKTEANSCISNSHCTKSDISEQQQGLNNKNDTLTKTEKKIQSLKVLLAEQEKAINKLKSENRERIFESKGFLTKEDHEYSLGKQVSCKNESDVSVKSHHKLIPKNDFYKEFKTKPTSRKRMRTEDTTLSNTKRFRYNFRKDIPLDIDKSLEKKTKGTVSLFKDKITLESFRGDMVKETFTQDEFLSFFGLVRTTVTVSNSHQDIVRVLV